MATLLQSPAYPARRPRTSSSTITRATSRSTPRSTSTSCAAASATTASQSIPASYMPKASDATRRPASRKPSAIVELFTRLLVPKTPTLVGPEATGGTTDGNSEYSQWVFSRQDAMSSPAAAHPPQGPCQAMSEAHATCASVAAPITAAAARAAAPSGTFVLNARTDTYFAGATGDVFAETVEPLVAHDARYRTDLLATLETYLANDCNINATARAVYAHRHTVAYRLDRVKELSGLDPMQTEDRERLGLGLKAYRIIAPGLPR